MYHIFTSSSALLTPALHGWSVYNLYRSHVNNVRNFSGFFQISNFISFWDIRNTKIMKLEKYQNFVCLNKIPDPEHLWNAFNVMRTVFIIIKIHNYSKNWYFQKIISNKENPGNFREFYSSPGISISSKTVRDPGIKTLM